MGEYEQQPDERRKDHAMREKVETAIVIGRHYGFIDAADFIHAANIPKSLAYRLLAMINPSNY